MTEQDKKYIRSQANSPEQGEAMISALEAKHALAKAQNFPDATPRRETIGETLSSPRRWLEGASKFSGGVAGAFTRPIAGLLGQGTQLAGLAPSPAMVPQFEFMGGNVTVNRPGTPQGNRELFANSLETALIVAPSFKAVRGLLPAGQAFRTGAGLGATYGLGEAVRKNENLLQGVDTMLEYGLMSGGLNKGLSWGLNPGSFGSDLATWKQQLYPEGQMGKNRLAIKDIGRDVLPHEDVQADMSTKNKLLDQEAAVLKDKIAKAREQMDAAKQLQLGQRKTAEVNIGREVGSSQELRSQRDALKLAASQRLKAESGVYEQDMASLQKQMDEALPAAVDKMKSDVPKLLGSGTKIYGNELKAVNDSLQKNGTPLSLQQIRADMVDTTLSDMEAAGVPKEAPIYKRIDAIAKAPEPTVENAGFPDTISAAQLPRIRAQALQGLRPGVLNGSTPANADERWILAFDSKYGDFIANTLGDQFPDFKTINAEYRPWRQAIEWGFNKFQPRQTIKGLNRGAGALENTATGSQDFEAQRAIPILENGFGRFPGLGKGTVGKDVLPIGEAMQLRKQQNVDFLTKATGDLDAQIVKIEGERDALANSYREMRQQRREIGAPWTPPGTSIAANRAAVQRYTVEGTGLGVEKAGNVVKADFAGNKIRDLIKMEAELEYQNEQLSALRRRRNWALGAMAVAAGVTPPGRRIAYSVLHVPPPLP